MSLARKSCRTKKEPLKNAILLRNLYWRGGSKKSSILTIFAKKLHIFCYLLTKSGQKWPPRGVVTGLISPHFSYILGPLFGDFCSKSSRNPGTRSRISRAKMTIFDHFLAIFDQFFTFPGGPPGSEQKMAISNMKSPLKLAKTSKSRPLFGPPGAPGGLFLPLWPPPLAYDVDQDLLLGSHLYVYVCCWLWCNEKV